MTMHFSTCETETTKGKELIITGGKCMAEELKFTFLALIRDTEVLKPYCNRAYNLLAYVCSRAFTLRNQECRVPSSPTSICFNGPVCAWKKGAAAACCSLILVVLLYYFSHNVMYNGWSNGLWNLLTVKTCPLLHV